MKSVEKFYECPRCESKSLKRRFVAVYILSIGIFLQLTVIGIPYSVPFIFLAPIIFVVELISGIRFYGCRDCKYEFYINTRKKLEE